MDDKNMPSGLFFVAILRSVEALGG
jgi:hypothetical protein